ncbi:MAG: hypothetical protein KF912_10010 [Phycisphaeraceae bacterium]|nr:hypothetical protein [Phycisphaeraceae bacterium]MBX3367630.1 hypothetical protein [Phycisphaeraceae bacterium]
MDDTVNVMTVFDDGSGPAVYAAGVFTTAGGVTVNRIAKWNGSAWSALSGPSDIGFDGIVRAMTVFNDGSGPALYVGGSFITAGGVTVNRIAKWNGSAWSALSGPSGVGASSDVYSLTTFNDGSGTALYASGLFVTAGGVTVNRVAKWNGSAWSALSGPGGIGADQFVSAIGVFDDGSGPALYAGGNLTSAGGVPVNRIAKWNGSAWSALPSPGDLGLNGQIQAMTVFNDGSGPALYVGGSFTTAGGVTANQIARWNGSAWSALSGPSGVGVNNSVRALAVHDDGSGPALFVGGFFNTAGGVTVNRIAKWNGSAWSAVSAPGGVGVNGNVVGMTVFNDGSGPALFAGGTFTAAGGVAVNRVAKWDGSDWSALANQSPVGMNGLVFDMAAFNVGSGPALYAGGAFTTAGGVTVNRVARWNGSAWSALTSPGDVGVSGAVFSVEAFNDGSGPALYAGGSFITAGGVTVNRIAKWNGSAWSALTGPGDVGLNNSVLKMKVLDDGSGPALYVGGSFTTAGGVTVNRIAKWNGSAWSALAGPGAVGVSGPVRAMAVYNDGSGPALYVGGEFLSAGGVLADYIARWNGSAWSPVGGGTDAPVRALAVFDDGSGPALYAAGEFTEAGFRTINRVARWDGVEWTALGGPPFNGVNNVATTLRVFDDGTGPALYVGGVFTTAGGVTVNRIAKWNGSSWSPLSGPGAVGMSFGVYSLCEFDDGGGSDLYAGGDFVQSGGVVSNGIARWEVCSPPPPDCPADVNGDGDLDVLDFLDFLDSFGTCGGLPGPCAGGSGVDADYNGDTIVDVLDFLDFLDAFGTGC